MSSLDLHPEELLDKATQGTLTTDERARLDAHLTLCSVCRFEHQVKRDFAAEALAMPAVDLDSMITRALAGQPTNTNRPTGELPAVLPTRRFGPWVAAAVMLSTMASFAAVARYTDVMPVVKAALASLLPGEPVFVKPAPASNARTARPAAELAVPPAVEPVAIAPLDEPMADVPPPPPPMVEAVVEAPKPVVHHTTRTVARAEPVQPVAAALPAPEPVVESAAALFATANEARVSGQRTQAIAQYSALLLQFPQAAEAQLSQAIVGRLLLDEGDAGAALTHFDAYLQTPEGGLREEAIEARARALRVLGRSDDEAKAWQQLLTNYPQSIYKERAEARLNALAH